MSQSPVGQEPAPPRRAHRAVVVVLLIVACVVWLVLTFPRSISGQSWIALGVVVLVAAVSGIAFSYTRYFPRRR